MKYCDTCHASYPNDFQVCPRDNAPLRATSQVLEGLVIANKYSVLEKIGSGGMATVFRARHLAFNEVRAIKVINSRLADESVLSRFKTEAVISRKLQHPHAVHVDDFDVTADGRPFIVMEYVEGRSLRKIIRSDGPMNVSRALNIAAQVAEALGAAHELGIIHRDIKPDNILLTKNGDDPEFVKVLDFGIAKVQEQGAIDVGEDYTPTQTGMVVGTPAYISPEQARGRMGAELDGRADLYSLGVVLYEMVTGQLPFESETSMDMILHHLNTPPVPPHKLRPELHIPHGVSLILMKALEKDRNDRFQSADEMLHALRHPAEWAAHGRSHAGARLFASSASGEAKPASAGDDSVIATGVRGSENYEPFTAARTALPRAARESIAASSAAGGRIADTTLPIPRMVSKTRIAGGARPGKVRIFLEFVLLLLLLVNGLYLYQHPAALTGAQIEFKQWYAAARSGISGLRARLSEKQDAANQPANPSPDSTNISPSSANGDENNPAASQANKLSNAGPSNGGHKQKPSMPASQSAAQPRSLNTEKTGASKNIAAASVAGGFGELHGVVVGANHQPAADITVELENAGLGFDQNAVTDADGRFEFSKVPTGRDYTLTAFKDGQAQDSHERITIRGGARLAVAPLEIESQQEVDLNAHVYGRVLDSGGAPLNGASIKLENQGLAINRGATTDAHGNYSFTEVPPGDGYKISVIRNGNILLEESGVKVDPANVNPDQVVILSLKR